MKWVRKNIVALWDGQPWTKGREGDEKEREANMAECDRIMIALHRFQTIGKVEYRRLVGMHGGGGGTSDSKFREILSEKVDKDLKSHYDGQFPDNGYWPNPVPNAPPPVLVGANDDDRCFAYTFCWHVEPEFLLWHRPLMAEFERGLQEYDPKFKPGDTRRHTDKDALGCPYWAWEGWDGLSLPQVVDNAVYVVKTNTWASVNYPKGSIFPNPFHRWFAPVTIEEQKTEQFPPSLTVENTTKRASAFHDYGSEFYYPWPQVSAPKNPSMKDVVSVAMINPSWKDFCTVKTGSIWSIENPHNKFHNHVGGMVLGGIQGPKKQVDQSTDTEYTGTMTQNQSIFDPIFWLHHSNVERQLYSWQRKFGVGTNPRPLSEPSEEQMNRVLYPWTKPDCLFQGEMSWNTPSHARKDGTFGDWWDHTTLPYEYDEYLEPVPSPQKGLVPDIIPEPPYPLASAIRMIVYMDAKLYKGGEYSLWFGDDLVGSLSILGGQGGVCARCASRKEGSITFEVSETFSTIEAAKKAFDDGKLCLARNGKEIKITRVEVEPWSAAV